jgi:hypothetical protein
LDQTSSTGNSSVFRFALRPGFELRTSCWMDRRSLCWSIRGGVDSIRLQTYYISIGEIGSVQWLYTTKLCIASIVSCLTSTSLLDNTCYFTSTRVVRASVITWRP